MSDLIPKIVITVEDGVITSMTADQSIDVVTIDYDVKKAGGALGEVVQYSRPEDIRSRKDIDAMIINTINELIEGY